MSILFEGLEVAIQNAGAILIFFSTVLGLGLVATRFLDSQNRESVEVVLLSAAGLGSVLLAILSFLLVLAGQLMRPAFRYGSIGLALLAMFALLNELRLHSRLTRVRPRWALSGTAIFLLLLMRLGFLRDLLMPPYSDSPIHYQIVAGFLNPQAESTGGLSIENMATRYYHFGFHAIAAWLSSLVAIPPGQVIPLLGQMSLVIAPLSVAALTFKAIRNPAAAGFAGLLSALGWWMPAFSANWGKYPALTAAAVAPAVLIALAVAWESRSRKTAWTVALVCAGGAGLIHTRILICLLLAAASGILAWKLVPPGRLRFWPAFRLAFLYVLSLLPFIGPLREFYGGILVAALSLIVLPFAFQAYPRLCAATFFFLFGFGLLTLLPAFPIRSAQTWLDLQFVEILLYIPLAVAGGAGFAALLELVPPIRFYRLASALALAGAVWAGGWPAQPLHPDGCCDYFGLDDRLAFEWIESQAPTNALVLTAAFNSGGQMIGSDAGIWIPALTGRPANRVAFDTDWMAGEVEPFCANADATVYVYAGGRQFSFIAARLEGWTRLVFRSGRTRIYQATGCPSLNFGRESGWLTRVYPPATLI